MAQQVLEKVKLDVCITSSCYPVMHKIPCLPSMLQRATGMVGKIFAACNGQTDMSVAAVVRQPPCRAFKPDYDKVARFLQSQPNGPHKVHALRLDCATNVSGSRQLQLH